MKVLLAVGSDQVSKNIADRYLEKFNETLEYKTVFYFKALIDEVRRNPSYDAIVINEDALAQYKSKDNDQIDAELFGYVDTITDEVQDTNIVYICSNRRTRGDSFVVRLYHLGIYNILIGDDRVVNSLCEIIHKPKTKREAKEYLNIDAGAVSEANMVRDDEVAEDQIMNILSFYDKHINEPENYVKYFNDIVPQYNKVQLKIILEVLPEKVRNVILEEPKFKRLLNAEQPEVKAEEVKEEAKATVVKMERKKSPDFFGVFRRITNRGKDEKENNAIVNLDAEKAETKEENKENESLETKPLTEQAVLFAEAKKKLDEENEKKKFEKEQQELLERAKKEALEREQNEPKVEEVEAQKETSVDYDAEKMADQILKEIAIEDNNRTKQSKKEEQEDNKTENIIDVEPIIITEGNIKNASDATSNLNKNEAEVIKTDNIDSNFAEEEKKVQLEKEKLLKEQEEIKKVQAQLEEQRKKLKEEQEKLESEKSKVEPTPTVAPKTYESTQIMPRDYKKIVAFVGANKAGTSFMVNAIASELSKRKILTGILDMTKDRGMYYIYNQSDKTLRKYASECMQRLSNGEDHYLPIEKYLKVYTTIPSGVSDSRRGYKHKSVIDTVKNNNNITIIDADFTTPIDYFEQVSEIYLVQDMDILKMQEATVFLREMKNRNIDMSKIKIIINKYVKNILTPKKIVEGLSYYKDPEMTFIDTLLTNKVDFYEVPYNLNNYIKYIECLYKGTMNFKGYTTDFEEAITNIANHVYSQGGAGQTKKGRGIFG